MFCKPHNINCLLALAFAVLAGSGTATAQTLLTGRVRVMDGDSLRMGKTEIRLFGVDAFEYRQTCGQFACGRAALMQMRDLTNWQVVTCKPRDIDRYGRTVAQCFDSKGRDLAKLMVASGYAVAYRQHSRLYIADEVRAKKAKAGAWAYPFQSPETWRAEHPSH